MKTLSLFKPPGDLIAFEYAYRRAVGTVTLVSSGRRTTASPPPPSPPPAQAEFHPGPRLRGRPPAIDPAPPPPRPQMMHAPLMSGRVRGGGGRELTALVAFEKRDAAAASASTPRALGSHPAGFTLTDLPVEEATSVARMMGIPLLVMLDGGGDAMLIN